METNMTCTMINMLQWWQHLKSGGLKILWCEALKTRPCLHFTSWKPMGLFHLPKKKGLLLFAQGRDSSQFLQIWSHPFKTDWNDFGGEILSLGFFFLQTLGTWSLQKYKGVFSTRWESTERFPDAQGNNLEHLPHNLKSETFSLRSR